MKSWMICLLALPGVERDTYRKRPALRVSSSDTTPIDVAVVLLKQQRARALSLQYTFYVSSRSISLSYRFEYRASVLSA
jgi:hypothetical protein